MRPTATDLAAAVSEARDHLDPPCRVEAGPPDRWRSAGRRSSPSEPSASSRTRSAPARARSALRPTTASWALAAGSPRRGPAGVIVASWNRPPKGGWRRRWHVSARVRRSSGSCSMRPRPTGRSTPADGPFGLERLVRPERPRRPARAPARGRAGYHPDMTDPDRSLGRHPPPGRARRRRSDRVAVHR